MSASPSGAVTLDTLGQVAITVRDVEQATAFYRDTLGVPFLFSAPPSLAFFRLGDVRLMLSHPEGSEAHQSSPLYFRVTDIGAVHAALAARGVPFIGEPHIVHRDERVELWMAFFRDPSGNLLALMEEARPAA